MRGYTCNGPNEQEQGYEKTGIQGRFNIPIIPVLVEFVGRKVDIDTGSFKPNTKTRNTTIKATITMAARSFPKSAKTPITARPSTIQPRSRLTIIGVQELLATEGPKKRLIMPMTIAVQLGTEIVG